MFNLKFNKMRTIYGLLVFVLLAGFTIACDKDDDKIDESSVKTAKLPHMGFDFSEGKTGGDVDGEVIEILYKEDDWVEKCYSDDKQIFHRRCDRFGEKRELKITPQTSRKNRDSSTGIGIGYIYISDDMSHYRAKSNTKKKEAKIFIGRPIVKVKCTP